MSSLWLRYQHTLSSFPPFEIDIGELGSYDGDVGTTSGNLTVVQRGARQGKVLWWNVASHSSFGGKETVLASNSCFRGGQRGVFTEWTTCMLD